ncbi:MAG TPA: hypothetical protein VFG49_00620 [Dyella sp.]|nr:hypothetical protein [Dyella sp.]
MAEMLFHRLTHIAGKRVACAGDGLLHTAWNFRSFGGDVRCLALDGQCRDTGRQGGAGHHAIGNTIGFLFQRIVRVAHRELALHAVVLAGALAAFALAVVVRATAALALQNDGTRPGAKGGSLRDVGGGEIAHGGTPRRTAAGYPAP